MLIMPQTTRILAGNQALLAAVQTLSARAATIADASGFGDTNFTTTPSSRQLLPATASAASMPLPKDDSAKQLASLRAKQSKLTQRIGQLEAELQASQAATASAESSCAAARQSANAANKALGQLQEKVRGQREALEDVTSKFHKAEKELEVAQQLSRKVSADAAMERESLVSKLGSQVSAASANEKELLEEIGALVRSTTRCSCAFGLACKGASHIVSPLP